MAPPTIKTGTAYGGKGSAEQNPKCSNALGIAGGFFMPKTIPKSHLLNNSTPP